MAQLAKTRDCPRLYFRDLRGNEDTAAGKHLPLHLAGDKTIWNLLNILHGLKML